MGPVLRTFLCKIFPQQLASLSLMSNIYGLGVSQANAQSEFLFPHPVAPARWRAHPPSETSWV